MNSREVLERFNQLNENNKIVCTLEELNSFLMCGLLIPNDNNYITRDFKIINVTTIKSSNHRINIDFRNLLNDAYLIKKNKNINKVYFMTPQLLDEYKQKDLIINKKGNIYYSRFKDDNWLVKLIGGKDE